VLAQELLARDMRQVLVLPVRARERDWTRELVAANEFPIVFAESTRVYPWARQMAALAREVDARLIHAHFNPADNVSLLTTALLWLRRPWSRCKLVNHYHSPPVPQGGVKFILGFIKYGVLGRWYFHIPVSAGVRAVVLSRGIPAGRCHTVLNAVEVERAIRRSASVEEVRGALGISPSARVFLLFGHDAHRKGVDLALQAMARLAEERPDAVLVLVGEEPMRRYVDERLTEKPPWLRLAEPRSFVADYFAVADVFLSPSRREGLPYAVLEAMVNGLPVVAADIPGMEWAHDAPQVRLVPTEDIDALRAAMGEVLASPPADGDAARAYVRRRHSAQSWAEQIADVYEKILGRSKPSPRPVRCASAGCA
jgi:glycosyltransferase involved in cell wall biosynthesis